MPGHLLALSKAAACSTAFMRGRVATAVWGPHAVPLVPRLPHTWTRPPIRRHPPPPPSCSSYSMHACMQPLGACWFLVLHACLLAWKAPLPRSALSHEPDSISSGHPFTPAARYSAAQRHACRHAATPAVPRRSARGVIACTLAASGCGQPQPGVQAAAVTDQQASMRIILTRVAHAGQAVHDARPRHRQQRGGGAAEIAGRGCGVARGLLVAHADEANALRLRPRACMPAQ